MHLSLLCPQEFESGGYRVGGGGEGNNTMLAGGETRTKGDRRSIQFVQCEVVNADYRSHNVNNGIYRTYFVEVNLRSLPLVNF